MQGPELPIPNCLHTMINMGDEKIMVIGGMYFSPETFIYNRTQEAWSVGPSLNQGRNSHASGIVTDELTKEKLAIVTGGWRWLSVEGGHQEVGVKTTEILKADIWVSGNFLSVSGNLHFCTLLMLILFSTLSCIYLSPF